MRSPCLVLAALLVALSMLPVAAVADSHPGTEADTTDPPPGVDGNATANETANNTTAGGNGQGADASAEAQEKKTARQEELERRRQELRGDTAAAFAEWRQQQLERLDAERRALQSQFPAHMRGHIGHLVGEGDTYSGTYVSVTGDRNLGVVKNMSSSKGVLLFEEIFLPISAGAEVDVDVHAKHLRVSSTDWRLWLQDAPAIPLHLSTTEDAPFLLVFPERATLAQTPSGLEILYHDASGAAVLKAQLIGRGLEPQPDDPSTVLVDDRASFHLSTARPILSQVANQVRPHLEAALQKQTLGAEVTVMNGEGGIADDVVLYEDMVLDVAAATAEGETATDVYTVTVDSAQHTGKTVVVNFEKGMLDLERLSFRYFNVDADRVVEAPIMQASSLQDVLEPLDDGTVAEYWVVTDIDGTSLLLSIPHFSVHKIEVSSFAEVVVEQPSLVVGVLGAIVVVAAATAGLFRRPDEQ